MHLPIPKTRLSSIPLLPSSHPDRLASRNSTQFNSSAPKLTSWRAGVSKLDSVQFLCSQAHILAGWRLETRLSSILLLPSSHPGVSKLDSVQFLCSQAHILAGWCLETRLSSIALLPSSHPGRLASRNSTQFFSTELFITTTLHGPRRKHSLSIVGKA
jgi:hypothetical protein